MAGVSVVFPRSHHMNGHFCHLVDVYGLAYLTLTMGAGFFEGFTVKLCYPVCILSPRVDS